MRNTLQKFIEYVRHPTACWEWDRAKTTKGYGQLKGDSGKVEYAHRISYELFYGKIPDELQIDHLCRNRACVNPLHLEAVTCRVNILRGVGVAAKNARKTHCPRGHKLCGGNLIVTDLQKRRYRNCLICSRLRNYKYMLKHKKK